MYSSLAREVLQSNFIKKNQCVFDEYCKPNVILNDFNVHSYYKLSVLAFFADQSLDMFVQTVNKALEKEKAPSETRKRKRITG